MYLESRITVLWWPNWILTRPTAVQNPAQCVSSKMLIGKLSGNKLGAAGPPFQKIVLAVLSMKIGWNYIPSKSMPGQIYTNQNNFPRENIPWLFKSLLASIRKKASLYNKAKRTNKADLWAKYKLCNRQIQRAIRSARWSFLKNKFSESLEQKIQNHSGVISN